MEETRGLGEGRSREASHPPTIIPHRNQSPIPTPIQQLNPRTQRNIRILVRDMHRPIPTLKQMPISSINTNPMSLTRRLPHNQPPPILTPTNSLRINRIRTPTPHHIQRILHMNTNHILPPTPRRRRQSPRLWPIRKPLRRKPSMVEFRTAPGRQRAQRRLQMGAQSGGLPRVCGCGRCRPRGTARRCRSPTGSQSEWLVCGVGDAGDRPGRSAAAGARPGAPRIGVQLVGEQHVGRTQQRRLDPPAPAVEVALRQAGEHTLDAYMRAEQVEQGHQRRSWRPGLAEHLGEPGVGLDHEIGPEGRVSAAPDPAPRRGLRVHQLRADALQVLHRR